LPRYWLSETSVPSRVTPEKPASAWAVVKVAPLVEEVAGDPQATERTAIRATRKAAIPAVTAKPLPLPRTDLAGSDLTTLDLTASPDLQRALRPVEAGAATGGTLSLTPDTGRSRP